MSDFVTVDIPQGRLRGKRVTSSANGATYYSFQGIPYAKPPVGPLRFKPPEEPEPWVGTRDVTVEGDVAPQIDSRAGKFIGKEDCLFLNLYTPQLHATSPKAVMVWIHGGAFIIGSGNTDMYGPDFLVAEDVVLVTINYRLGALGFLYLDGADITGNNGLRDQVMALKWVKNHIAKFGGDPGNVTIFGESAGGTSVHYLMMSPLATGLFHRAIAQSGTALIGSANIPPDVSSRRAARFAKYLGCTSNDPQKAADFLRSIPSEVLVKCERESLSEEEKGRLLALIFYPTEEAGPAAFLPASPRDLLQEGHFAKVPFMTGVTSAEGKMMLFEMYLHDTLSEVNKNFENVLPPDLVPKTGNGRSIEIANIIKKFYFGDQNLNENTKIHYIDMMSDLMFVYPLHETVTSQVKWSLQPTYVYLFDHIIETHINVLTGEVDNLPGATHAAELPYLFKNTAWSINFSPGSADAQMRSKLIKLWTQFAKSGNPSSDELKVTWTPATKGKLNILKINGGFEMASDLYNRRIDFLEKLYSKFFLQEAK